MGGETAKRVKYKQGTNYLPKIQAGVFKGPHPRIT